MNEFKKSIRNNWIITFWALFILALTTYSVRNSGFSSPTDGHSPLIQMATSAGH